MLRCEKRSLFKLLLWRHFKWLVAVQNFLLLDLYPAKLQLPVTSPSVLHKTHCHWNMFDISRTNLVDNILVLLIVRCNLDFLNVGVLCFCYDQLDWCFYLYTFPSDGYSLLELYVDVDIFWLWCWKSRHHKLGNLQTCPGQQLTLQYLLHLSLIGCH